MNAAKVEYVDGRAIFDKFCSYLSNFPEYSHVDIYQAVKKGAELEFEPWFAKQEKH